MDIRPRWVLVVLMVASAFCLLMMASLASAHDWYDWACCSNGDCRPAYSGEVRQTVEGFEHVPSGQVIEQRWIKPSRDGEYHVCIPPDGVWRDGLKVKCIYVPFSS